MTKLVIFGCGYSGLAIASKWQGEVIGTTRVRHDILRANKVRPYSLEDISALNAHILSSDAILISTPAPDPVFQPFGEAIASSNAWVGYLSTTAVYGDRSGDWVDETTKPAPTSIRGIERTRAENDWKTRADRMNIFRLAGIYGPDRGPFEKIKSGKTKKIIKENQVFGRIHVEDIARIICASIAQNDHGEIYNLTDDLPAPPQDVLDYAAQLLGLPPLPAIDFANAKLTPMARSFYGENKRVSNLKIRERFGEMLYPDYKSGLLSCLT